MIKYAPLITLLAGVLPTLISAIVPPGASTPLFYLVSTTSISPGTLNLLVSLPISEPYSTSSPTKLINSPSSSTVHSSAPPPPPSSTSRKALSTPSPHPPQPLRTVSSSTPFLNQIAQPLASSPLHKAGARRTNVHSFQGSRYRVTMRIVSWVHSWW